MCYHARLTTTIVLDFTARYYLAVQRFIALKKLHSRSLSELSYIAY